MLRYLAIGGASLLVLALLSIAASADTVRLKTGGTIDGIVAEDGNDYVIEVPFGTMRVGKELVDSVEKKDTPFADHKRQAAALADDDAEGWTKLARWAQRNDLPTLAEEDFARAIEGNPDHEAARKALGHEKIDGKWLTHDEAMAARGMIRMDGKWVSKEAADLMKALAEAKALEAEAREAEARAREEEARAERESQRAEQETRLASLREQEAQRRASRRRSYYDDYGTYYGGYYPYRSTVLFYPGRYYYPYGGSSGCHGGTPYYELSDGHGVTIEQSGGQTQWVHHSGGCYNDQHSTIHNSGDGHIVDEQIVNGRQQLLHRTAPGADPDIVIQHR